MSIVCHDTQHTNSKCVWLFLWGNKINDIFSVLQVHFKNELVLVLVHFTKKRTFRSFLVLWEKVN